MSILDDLNAPASDDPQVLPMKRTIYTIQQEQVAAAIAIIDKADPGTPWPFQKLTEMTDTLVRGSLVLIGAYTGSGKTTLMLNAMDGWADAGNKVLMFGTEQSAKDLRIKIACMRLGILARDARRGRPGDADKEQLRRDLNEMVKGEKANVHLYNSACPTPDQLERAIRIYHKKGVGLVLVDYLGRVDLSEGREPEWQKMKTLVRRLKNLAVELDIVIVAAAQIGKNETPELSRHVRPELSSFMGGQSLPQEADVALGIYQPLKPGTGLGELREVRAGNRPVDEVVEASTMAVSLLKHREDMPLGTTTLFWVANNRIQPRGPLESQVPREMLSPRPRKLLPDPDLPF